VTRRRTGLADAYSHRPKAENLEAAIAPLFKPYICLRGSSSEPWGASWTPLQREFSIFCTSQHTCALQGKSDTSLSWKTGEL